jgi:Icc-related predicted phosphoesterase
MKIAFISDTHTFHKDIVIPEADVLVHCGDNTIYGETWEFVSFLEWFGSQKPPHKIFINGNHEVRVAKLGLTKDMVAGYNLTHSADIHYLEESGVEIEGIKFWGSPYTPEFFDWAYMYERKDGERRWMGIPDDVDVLITHGPPFGILDGVQPVAGYNFENAGCTDLLAKINEVKPKVHAFGHIHSHYGWTSTSHIIEDTEEAMVLGRILFVNASTCDESYTPVHPVLVVDTETWEIINEN